jgi:amino acid transporter
MLTAATMRDGEPYHQQREGKMSSKVEMPTVGVFLRKATGLVREVSLTDAFLMNSIGMNVGLGASVMFLQGPALFPGGDIVVATLIATVAMAFTLLYVYSEFAAAMPRSGGDYIFVSRALNPFLGWLLSWSQAIWLIFFWVGFNAWAPGSFVIPGSLDIIGAALHDPALFQVAQAVSTPGWTIVIGTIINVAFGVLLFFGTRRYWRWQKVAFLFAALSVVLTIVLLAANGGAMPADWNRFVHAVHQGLPYGGIVPTAARLGFHWTAGFQLWPTLLMIPLAFFTVGYAQGSAQIGGEVKRASRTQYLAMVGGVLVNGLVLALMGWVLLRTTGAHWLGALGFLYFGHPTVLGLSFTPYYNLLASLLTRNVLILALIGFGYIMWAVNGTPLSMLQATRYMLAWSMDRMAPQKLADVSERYHSPIWAVILSTVTGELALIALTFIPTLGILSALMAQVLAFLLVCAAGIAFPYKLRKIWETSGTHRTLLGVPKVVWAGIGGIVVLGFILVLYVIEPSLGATGQLSLIVSGSVFAAGVIWWFAARALQRARGVDPVQAYGEIPPE